MPEISERKPELTSGQVARRIGVTAVTVRSLTKRGLLPAWQIGNRLRYTSAAVEDFLKQSELPKAA
jgi:excisionase family DNA binding protein